MFHNTRNIGSLLNRVVAVSCNTVIRNTSILSKWNSDSLQARCQHLRVQQTAEGLAVRRTVSVVAIVSGSQEPSRRPCCKYWHAERLVSFLAALV